MSTCLPGQQQSTATPQERRIATLFGTFQRLIFVGISIWPPTAGSSCHPACRLQVCQQIRVATGRCPPAIPSYTVAFCGVQVAADTPTAIV